MGRAKTVKNLYDKKFITFDFTGFWLKVFGTPERGGIWTVYGIEKNGKTWFSLLFAEYLSQFAKVLYISAEEGTGMTFTDAVKRAKLSYDNPRLHFEEYMPIEAVLTKLSKKRNTTKIVFFDNVSFYQGEITKKIITQIMRDFPTITFIFLAHEERNQPDGAVAKFIKKMSKVFVQIKGLSAFVAGRCPGGVINIDEEKAQLYHGTNLKKV